MSELIQRAMGPERDDLDRFAQAFAENGMRKDPKVVRWLFAQNPQGSVVADIAVDPACHAWAAVYAAVPLRLHVRGVGQVPALLSLDTLTDQRYRKRGLFKKLATGVYDRARDSGQAVVYGFPNANSAFGFFERLDWQKMDPVPFLMAPLSAGWLVRRTGGPDWLADGFDWLERPLPRRPRLAAGDEINEFYYFDASFDALWREVRGAIPVGLVRDREFLSWRFQRPDQHYRHFAFRRAGRLRGFVSYSLEQREGGPVGRIMELLYVPSEAEVGKALLTTTLREMMTYGAGAVLAWCMEQAFSRSVYRSAGFFSLPERLKPLELHFGALDLSAEGVAEVARRDAWYISYVDSDTV